MDDPLKEELLPGVVEAKPMQEQRFMHQCKICSSIKFEIIFVKEAGVKSMILTCSKGHETIMKDVPEIA